MSAAALSAAVDATNWNGSAPNWQGKLSKEKPTTWNPSRSSEEGVWGRGASLREAASPPELPYSFPRMSAAALSAAVDATNWNGAYPTCRGNQVRRIDQLEPQPLFGRGGLRERPPYSFSAGKGARGGALFKGGGLPHCVFSRRGRNQLERSVPNWQGEPSKENRPTGTPAALRERGSGGEALLSEKRPLPQNLPEIP